MRLCRKDRFLPRIEGRRTARFAIGTAHRIPRLPDRLKNAPVHGHIPELRKKPVQAADPALVSHRARRVANLRLAHQLGMVGHNREVEWTSQLNALPRFALLVIGLDA